jgi:flagellar hook protein FlgE
MPLGNREGRSVSGHHGPQRTWTSDHHNMPDTQRGRPCSLQSGSLEDSNVNLTSKLANLIVAQQTMALNAQALIARNQVMADTTALIA